MPKSILIHTSVKLVTYTLMYFLRWGEILIHTSVKLVTLCTARRGKRHNHFNPHEREARDL